MEVYNHFMAAEMYLRKGLPHIHHLALRGQMRMKSYGDLGAKYCPTNEVS